jgi:phosphoribosylaminoimidazole-succinocarboxamide synthase
LTGLTDSEIGEVKEVLLKVDDTITEIAAKANLVNEDGKIELAFDEERRLMVADVVGTLDECRFTYQGFHVSKEIARIYYRRTEWAKEVEQAKQKAKEQGVKDWRTLVKAKPPKLEPKLKTLISQMYMAATNEITGKELFETPKLVEIIRELKNATTF